MTRLAKTARRTTKKAKKARRRSSAKGPLNLKQALEKVFRQRFPDDTVDISDGYKGNVHVLVVSRNFDGLGDRQRYAMLWRIVESAGLTKAQEAKVSLLMGVSPSEIK